MKIDIEHLRQWIGRSETRSDEVTAAPVAGLSVTLDRDDPYPKTGDVLPPLWHVLYFLPLSRQSELRIDGMGKTSTFLPPVPLPRQVYGGTEIQFFQPLKVGERITRTSKILDVQLKEGRNGSLVLIKLQNEIQNSSGPALIEKIDMVFREDPKPTDAAPAPQPAETDAQWRRSLRTNSVQLFRFSALMFNSHRIHYDHKYAVEVERYPELLVQGSFTAVQVFELVRNSLPTRRVKQYSSRAFRPIFNETPFEVCAKLEPDQKTLKLWVSDSEGFLALGATAVLD